MQYQQENKNRNNLLSGPGDFRIPALQALADAVTG
jgi:hypothetical protein